MKSVALILVTLGVASAVHLNQRKVNPPRSGNHIISKERHDKIKNRTAQWKSYKPEENPLYSLDESQLVGLLGLSEDPEEVIKELEKAGG